MNTHLCCSQRFPKGAHYHWKTRNRKYRNFTDLGRYVIDCDRHTHFDFRRARDYIEEHFDFSKVFACTAFGTRTDRGEVLIGRNLDLTVSQYPCYITHVKFGKYETINFTYDEVYRDRLRYDELLRQGWIDPDYYNALPMGASDSMNSEGLYLQYNMRGYEPRFFCQGTNPENPLRVCTLSLPFLVASHCATVPEALEYIRRHLNLYTLVDESVACGWNLCCMIGDAKGNYGLLEIAQDEVRFLPQQHGQGNYYLFPAYNCLSRDQSGYGRLQFGLERIDKVQSEKQMTHLMEQVMWKNEILHIPYAYRDRWGHIHFCGDPEHRTPSLDWRSDNVHMLPVNCVGEFVDVEENTPEARLVRGYKQCYDHYRAGYKTEENRIGYEKYQEYLNRCDLIWVQSDEHFEDLQKGLIRHYTENGAFEKLIRYYSGDETPLREDGLIFTTGLSFTVNCTCRHLTVRFWENKETTMTYQW